MRIVTSWSDYPSAILGYNERALIHWLRSVIREGETWLDIGGHYGYTAMAMAQRVGYAGRVFTFEPTLATAGCLSRTIGLNCLEQVTVLPLALGYSESLHMNRTAVVRGMSDNTVKAGDEETTILVASFDWLWPRICGGNRRIDGVKIDVQGAEINVLQGMERSLKECKPKLALELHQGVDRRALLQILESCGYDCEATPIEPAAGETSAQYLDNHSYEFRPRSARATPTSFR